MIINKTLSHIKPMPMVMSLLMLGSAFVGCNKAEESDIDADKLQAASTYSTTAITSFSLSDDSKVMDNLSSVFFSIDLDHGVIYNADSLPMGTKITKLVPKIDFQTTMSKAMIYQTGGSVRTDSVNFLENENDSIDFSGKVILRVTSYDQQSTRDYEIKVNVHNSKPDSLAWEKLAVAELPSRMAKPKAQKTVLFKDTPTTIIEEANGSFTISTASDIYQGTWIKKELPLSFKPQIRSLTPTDNALWILDVAGNLFTSADGTVWTPTGQKWVAIIGPYLNSILGIHDTPTGLAHCHWPANPTITDGPLENGFPVSGFTASNIITSKWAAMPTLLFCGGTLPTGEPTPQTWAFDGSAWAEIADAPLPALTGALMVAYQGYRSDGSSLGQIQLPSLVVFGGRLADGKANRKVYTSFDNGVNWRLGDTSLQLPDFFPNIWDADGIVVSSKRSADLTQLWAPRQTRSVTINGFEASWECPYIYVAGGIQPDGTLTPTIWRGVILRLEELPKL